MAAPEAPACVLWGGMSFSTKTITAKKDSRYSDATNFGATADHVVAAFVALYVRLFGLITMSRQAALGKCTLCNFARCTAQLCRPACKPIQLFSPPQLFGLPRAIWSVVATSI